MNILTYATENMLVSLSCVLRWNDKKQSKSLEFPVKWADLTEETFGKYIDSSKNGFAVLTGQVNGFIVIDADEAKASAAGCPIPPEILNALEAAAEPIVKTPNGRHFYFAHDGEFKSSTDIRWNGTRVKYLDMRANGGIILAPPTTYQRGDKACRYEFIKGDFREFNPLPESICSALTAVADEPIQDYVESTTDAIAEDLLKALNASRWDNRDDWLRIGIILFNEGLPCSLWDQYSRVSSRYAVDGCLRAWRSFHKGNLTIRSLWKMVKEDNQMEYKRLQYKHINIKAHLMELTHLSVAKLYHALRSDDYVYAHEQGWFERMENNVWRNRGSEPPSLLLSVPQTLLTFVDEFYSRARQDLETAPDERREFYKNEMNTLMKVRATLQSVGFIKNVIQVALSLYASDDFFGKLDTAPNLFAFENGVYDLDAGVFRDIRPEDYISITCGYNYETNSNKAVREQIMGLIRSMFEDEEMCQYFLLKLSYMLHGRKRFQEFDMWKGKGSNGKSLLIRLLGNCFGPYMASLPVSYFTEENKSGKNAPLPALAACRGARLVWASEPEPNAVLQTGFLKQVSGDEKIKARYLHKNDIEYDPQFGVIMLLNDYPRIPRSTEFYALQRRIRIVPFPFQFMDKPECDNHRPINRSYEKLVSSHEWRTELIKMLIEMYVDTVSTMTSFKKPSAVESETSSFFQENNPLAAWLPKRFITNADQSSKVKASEITSLFLADNPNVKLDSRRIGSLMSALGFHSKKSDGVMVYRGFLKKEEAEFQD